MESGFPKLIGLLLILGGGAACLPSSSPSPRSTELSRPSQQSASETAALGADAASSAAPANVAGNSALPGKITLTLLDEMPSAPGYQSAYGTFGSHNQGIVETRGGIFITYLKSIRDQDSYGHWVLKRSIDGGKSFTPVVDGWCHCRAPSLDVDYRGRLLFFLSDWVASRGDLYVFDVNENGLVWPPRGVSMPGAGAGKSTSAVNGDYFYALTWSDLYTVYLPTLAYQRQPFFKSGSSAQPQYPYLSVDPTTNMMVAGHTASNNKTGNYQVNTAVFSWDGGQSWGTLLPQRTMIALPYVVDETGPGTMLTTLSDLQAVQGAAYGAAINWMQDIRYLGDRLHFMYLTGSGTRYGSFVWDAANPRFENRVDSLGGPTNKIAGVGAAFEMSAANPGVLYVIGSNEKNRIVAIRSRNYGVSWEDYAISERTFGWAYQVRGSHQVSGDLLGSFTDVNPAEGGGHKIYFFRVGRQ